MGFPHASTSSVCNGDIRLRLIQTPSNEHPYKLYRPAKAYTPLSPNPLTPTLTTRSAHLQYINNFQRPTHPSLYIFTILTSSTQPPQMPSSGITTVWCCKACQTIKRNFCPLHWEDVPSIQVETFCSTCQSIQEFFKKEVYVKGGT